MNAQNNEDKSKIAKYEQLIKAENPIPPTFKEATTFAKRFVLGCNEEILNDIQENLDDPNIMKKIFQNKANDSLYDLDLAQRAIFMTAGGIIIQPQIYYAEYFQFNGENIINSYGDGIDEDLKLSLFSRDDSETVWKTFPSLFDTDMKEAYEYGDFGGDEDSEFDTEFVNSHVQEFIAAKENATNTLSSEFKEDLHVFIPIINEMKNMGGEFYHRATYEKTDKQFTIELNCESNEDNFVRKSLHINLDGTLNMTDRVSIHDEEKYTKLGDWNVVNPSGIATINSLLNANIVGDFEEWYTHHRNVSCDIDIPKDEGTKLDEYLDAEKSTVQTQIL